MGSPLPPTDLGDHPERTYGGIGLAGGHCLVNQFI